jgi:hypothetical protein
MLHALPDIALDDVTKKKHRKHNTYNYPEIKMRKLKLLSVMLVASAVSAQLTGCATETPSAPPLSDRAAAYVDENRAGLREEKVLIINESMRLNSADPNYNAFWHQYYPYEAELKKINDQRLQLIRDYEFNYNQMDDRTANNLAERALTIRKNKLALLEQYYEKIKMATSPIIAARFLQVENDISLMIDVDIASSIPLLKKTK